MTETESDNVEDAPTSPGTDAEEGITVDGRPVSSIRHHNLAMQERVVRGHMPTLEVINERFSRYWRPDLFNYLRANAEIRNESAYVMKYGEFSSNLKSPSFINMVSLRPLKGAGLFVFSPELAAATIEVFFGADGSRPLQVNQTDFTPIEQSVMSNLLDSAMRHFVTAWKPVQLFEPTLIRSDFKPQFVAVATPSEHVVINQFTIEFEHGKGDFIICIPYSTVEPLREKLVSGVATDRLEADTRWARAMENELMDMSLEMRVELLERSITLGELADMDVGDFLTIEMPETVTAYVDTTPLAEGRYGISKGHYAFKMERRLHTNSQLIEQVSQEYNPNE